MLIFSATAPSLPEGAVVRGIDPTSTDATLIRLGKIVDALTPLLGKEEVAASLHAMVADMRRVASRIAGVVDKHTIKVDEALTELEAFSKAVGRMAHDVEGLMANMKTLTDPANAQSVHVTIKRLNETLQGLDDAGRAARSIVRKIDDGKGALGALINDERLAADIRALIRKLKDEPITVKLKLL